MTSTPPNNAPTPPVGHELCWKTHDGLRRSLATANARIAELEGQLREAKDCGQRVDDQLRAAEERAGKAERDAQIANDTKTTEKKILISEIEAHTATKARLSTIADDIDKTGAVEALQTAHGALCECSDEQTHPVTFRTVKAALKALTALQSRLRGNQP